MQIQDQTYFPRDYRNDFGEIAAEERPRLFRRKDCVGQCKRVALAALPVLAFYEPIASPLSVISNSVRCITSIQQLFLSCNTQECSLALLSSVIAVSTLAASFFSHTVAGCLSVGQDIGSDIRRIISCLQKGNCRQAFQEGLHLLGNSLYLAAMIGAPLEAQALSILIQLIFEGMSSYKEFKQGFALEGSSHLLVAALRSNHLLLNVQQLNQKWELEPLWMKAAHAMFHAGHKCSQPIHRFTMECYELASGSSFAAQSTLGKTGTLALTFFKGICIVPLLGVSVACSGMGALCLKVAGRNYLFMNYNQGNAPAKEEGDIEVLSYNVGFLPGELAEKLTVGEFPVSYEERQDLIVKFLVEQFQTSDVLLLQEAVDFGFVMKLENALHASGIASSVYSRMGEPLNLGISSGLCIVSKKPLAGLEVSSLPGSEPFFNRVFVSCKLRDDLLLVNTHLNAGADDAVRTAQFKHIAAKVEGLASKTVYIGDYNFNDNWNGQDSLGKHIYSYIQEPTLQPQYTSESSTHPDFVASSVSPEEMLLKVKIINDQIYSDHLPIKVLIPA